MKNFQTFLILNCSIYKCYDKISGKGSDDLEKTDKELYKEFLNGSKEAFEEIVIKHKNSLIYFISRYTKNMYVAEDISQDVFVYLLLNRKKYNFKYSLKTFLFVIARSKALNYLKKEKRIIQLEDSNSIYYEELENEIFTKDKLGKIKLIINNLKPDYQEVIYLADFEHISYKDIAKITKKSESQVKNLIHSSRTKLRELLGKEGITYEN